MVQRLVAAVVGVVAVAVPAAASAQVPNPTVEGPVEGGVRGYPWNKSLFDLEKHDYSEKEYFFGGVATNLSTGLTAPYKSRMLVRLPRDPKDFSGTVTVEWLNVTGQNDLETVWPPAGEYLMEQGGGYVGVSAQLAGVCCGPTTLKGWDATRYAQLVHPGDEFSFDIFSQAIEALRDPEAGPTRCWDVEPEHIVANGASQSAGRLTTHVNDGYNRGGIDLYTITRGGGPYRGLLDADLPAERGGPGRAPARQRQLPRVGGGGHGARARGVVELRVGGAPARPRRRSGAGRAGRGMRGEPRLGGLQRAGAGVLDRGVPREGHARRPRSRGSSATRTGTWSATSTGWPSEGSGTRSSRSPSPTTRPRAVPLWGTYKSWSADKIKSLYPTHEEYVDQVTEWANEEVKLGWMIPADRDDAIHKAEEFDEPWTAGSCYDTFNEQANETGPLSGPIGQASFEPSLPGGSQAALRDANCNAVVALGL